jgi:probable rRNA maturation factor
MGQRSTILFRAALPKEERSLLRAFAAALTEEVLQGRVFTCLITRDKQLHALNLSFLGHDYPTDVLSFPSGDGESLGEIAISLDRAREQAAALGHDLSVELRILLLHGALHLLGMDHEKDRGIMRRAETKWRKHFQLPAGLIERSRR